MARLGPVIADRNSVTKASKAGPGQQPYFLVRSRHANARPTDTLLTYPYAPPYVNSHLSTSDSHVEALGIGHEAQLMLDVK